MKKLILLLLAVLLLTACAHVKEINQEIVYMNIMAIEAKQIMDSGEGYTNIREFGGIIDWPYEVE